MRSADPIRRQLIFTGLPLALASCALPPTKPDNAPAHPARQHGAWRLEGRLALSRGAERHHAAIVWQHDEHTDEILILGPLGQTLARLWRDGQHTELKANGETVTAADWSALAERMLGAALPLSDLARWLTGDLPHAESDALGRPRRATIDGWQITILQYEAAHREAWPSLIDLRRDDWQLRLKIDQWLP